MEYVCATYWLRLMFLTMTLLTVQCYIIRHSSYYAPIPYPAMLNFAKAELCTRVLISVTEWCIIGYLPDGYGDLQDGHILHMIPTTPWFAVSLYWRGIHLHPSGLHKFHRFGCGYIFSFGFTDTGNIASVSETETENITTTKPKYNILLEILYELTSD